MNVCEATMEEYNTDIGLRTDEQGVSDFPIDTNVASEINKENDILQDLESNISAALGTSSTSEQMEGIQSFPSDDFSSHLLKETSPCVSNVLIDKNLNVEADSIESGLENIHADVSDSVTEDLNPITAESVDNKMDCTEDESITESSSASNITSAKDQAEMSIDGTSIENTLEDNHELTNDKLGEKAPLFPSADLPEEVTQEVTSVEMIEHDKQQDIEQDTCAKEIVEKSPEIVSEISDQSNGTELKDKEKDTIGDEESKKDTLDEKMDATDEDGITAAEKVTENVSDTNAKSSENEPEQSDPIDNQNEKEDALGELSKTTEKSSEESVLDQRNSPKPTNTILLDQERDKANDNQQENTEFVQVNTENEKDVDDNEKDERNNRALMEQDPIASDSFEPLNEDREGADEELCIIPDTEREISQAEKDAASTIPPLRDLREASSSGQTENNSDATCTDHGVLSIIIFKYEKEDLQMCTECKLKRKVKYYFAANDGTKYICDDNCLDVLRNSQEDKIAFNWEEGSLRVKNFTGAIKEPPSLSFIRKCAACKKVTNDIENNLTWEIMDFCNEFCLSKYQKEIGANCSSCQGEVKSNSLGKYCVRFGNDIRQFCTSMCLEKYKKGLKVCSYCQQDMSGGPVGFLAPVGDKGQFKDFCSQLCMEKYDIMTNDRPPKVDAGTICSVCKAEKPITIEFELDGRPNYFCNEPCFVAFSFVNNISPGKCAMCRRHFAKSTLEKHTMYYDNVQHSFCSNSCENIYIIAHRKIVPCSWCKVKKYNFDMIRRYSKTGPMINMCSVNCLSLYRVSLNAVNSRKTVCNFCQKLTHPMYHLTMSDATIRNFCSYNCVMGFQNQFPKQPITLNNLGDSGFPVPTGAPKKNKKHPGGPDPVPPVTESPNSQLQGLPMPVISSVQSLANSNGSVPQPVGVPPTLTPINTRSTRSKSTANAASQLMNSAPQIINSFADLPIQVQIKQHFIVRPAPMPEQRNVATMCYTNKANKGTTTKPEMEDQEMQTEEREASRILIPIPVPIFVPTPMRMFSIPTPVPVPFPIPVPVPVFIPTTRNSAAGIMKEIKKIQVKIPTDPYEAELLMMAEMVAEEKKEVTDSESDDDTAGPEDSYSPEPVDASNTFGDDMLQMALKMATELDEPAVDLEGALTANTITAPQGGEPQAQDENVDESQPMHHMMERNPSVRGRKRGMRQSRGGGAKRGRRMSHHQVDIPMLQPHQVQQPHQPPEPVEKPDANMCLKYTFGVNAWKQWVTTKNTELEKSRHVQLFKTEILQLTSDELNYSLCLFVKEVRKPNGAEYAPDTIYYLCLGIQQYLFENGRIDNIFCDPYYEKFTDCLDEVAKKFSVLYNDSHYIVTRVEEEHLWESKQLGAHSPHVLLSTLMFFNTKHFNLTSVDEHMQLSFSHIMKHWKRNPNQPGASKVPGSRNVLLRFYPPQSAIQNNTRKKKVYEQEQNEENPLRCPVKLYEFYLSKCPESVKTRNDVFYLQPERSCVPDSPVWYSTMPLPREALEKMLHRVKMVKEINVALLTS